jgi:hypothetical protein
MTSKAAPGTSYTEYGCFKPNFGGPYLLQDYPPDSNPTVIRTSAGSAPAMPTDSGTPVQSSSSSPVGAIVGGVIGGLAVIAMLILGILYLRRRSPKPVPHEHPHPGPAYHNPPYSKEPPYSPNEAPPTFPPQTQFRNVGTQQATAPGPPLYDPRYSVTSSQGQGQGPTGSVGAAGPGNTPSPNPSTDAPYSNPASHGGLTRSSQPQTSMAGRPPALTNNDFNLLPASRPHAAAAGEGKAVGSPNSAEVEAVNPFGTRDNRAELSGAGVK